MLATGGYHAQTLDQPLFVDVVVLLVSDALRPTNAVFLTLPILVLWANLHGSVVIAAGLVALRGLLGLTERTYPRRYLALLLGAVLSVGITPYGTGVLDYYRSTLVNPAFRSIVTA